MEVQCQNGGTGNGSGDIFSDTLPHDESHSDHKIQHGDYICDMRVYMTHLHLINTLDCPKRGSGGKDAHVGPNGGIEEVWVTFLSPTLLYYVGQSDHKTQYGN